MLFRRSNRNLYDRQSKNLEDLFPYSRILDTGDLTTFVSLRVVDFLKAAISEYTKNLIYGFPLEKTLSLPQKTVYIINHKRKDLTDLGMASKVDFSLNSTLPALRCEPVCLRMAIIYEKGFKPITMDWQSFSVESTSPFIYIDHRLFTNRMIGVQFGGGTCNSLPGGRGDCQVHMTIDPLHPVERLVEDHHLTITDSTCCTDGVETPLLRHMEEQRPQNRGTQCLREAHHVLAGG